MGSTNEPAVLVLASGNQGKLRELAGALADWPWQLRSQADYAVPEAVEDGLSFVENALIKARNACEHTGLAALADDSGLVVPALGGEPGIYSARYAGVGASDQSNCQRLLDALQGRSDRRAWFECVLVLMRHARDPSPLIASARWHGEILRQPAGKGGFGYDPLFRPAGLSQSAAQMPADEKQRLSHRGQAVARLAGELRAEA